ncbi:MAG: hypothetical protein WD045_07315 [Pirellulaceae bacterium]
MGEIESIFQDYSFLDVHTREQLVQLVIARVDREHEPRFHLLDA